MHASSIKRKEHTMDIISLSFPGGLKVDANFNGFTVKTDQPVAGGGEGSAPGPFDMFLASLATCAGIFVLRFCQSRGISMEGIKIIQSTEYDQAAHRLAKLIIDINLPKGFPEKYREAVRLAADKCLVKRTIQNPPEMIINANIG